MTIYFNWYLCASDERGSQESEVASKATTSMEVVASPNVTVNKLSKTMTTAASTSKGSTQTSAAEVELHAAATTAAATTAAAATAAAASAAATTAAAATDADVEASAAATSAAVSNPTRSSTAREVVAHKETTNIPNVNTGSETTTPMVNRVKHVSEAGNTPTELKPSASPMLNGKSSTVQTSRSVSASKHEAVTTSLIASSTSSTKAILQTAAMNTVKASSVIKELLTSANIPSPTQSSSEPAAPLMSQPVTKEVEVDSSVASSSTMPTSRKEECKTSPFGCCDDGVSYATGKNQEGCNTSDKLPAPTNFLIERTAVASDRVGIRLSWDRLPDYKDKKFNEYTIR